jgi:hypothetical protein
VLLVDVAPPKGEKAPFDAAGDYREQPEQVFVDQSVLQHRSAERAAGADLEDVAARLFLQLAHGVDDVPRAGLRPSSSR